jgi:hypothetical protein
MTTYKPTVDTPASLEAAVQRYLADFPAVRASIERERRTHAKFLVPIEMLRAELDNALGERSLVDELYRMRGR